MDELNAIRQRLGEIKARADRATEGPWRCYIDGASEWPISGNDGPLVSQYSKPPAIYIENMSSGVDADFIAHARTDVPYLVAALEAALDIVSTAQEMIAVEECDHRCGLCGAETYEDDAEHQHTPDCPIPPLKQRIAALGKEAGGE